MSDASSLATQAEAKAEAKSTADLHVATEPHTIHGVKSMLTAPGIMPSTLVGAGIGAMAGGPPGALVGGVLGFLAERHRIFGGPVGRVIRAIRGH